MFVGSERGAKMKIKLELKWQNLWIGAYWEKKTDVVYPKYDYMPTIKKTWHIWICVVPCLPIHIW